MKLSYYSAFSRKRFSTMVLYMHWTWNAAHCPRGGRSCRMTTQWNQPMISWLMECSYMRAYRAQHACCTFVTLHVDVFWIGPGTRGCGMGLLSQSRLGNGSLVPWRCHKKKKTLVEIQLCEPGWDTTTTPPKSVKISAKETWLIDAGSHKRPTRFLKFQRLHPRRHQFFYATSSPK